MARLWRNGVLRQQYLTYFDGCGFGKYWVVLFRLALLMPLKPSHNLLVRGSNPCGGTNRNVSAGVMSEYCGLKCIPSISTNLSRRFRQVDFGDDRRRQPNDVVSTYQKDSPVTRFKPSRLARVTGGRYCTREERVVRLVPKLATAEETSALDGIRDTKIVVAEQGMNRDFGPGVHFCNTDSHF